MDNNPQNKTPKEPVMLEVRIKHSAIYWSEATCRFEARLGKIKFSETEITSNFYFTYYESVALEILKITDDEITFVVPALFCSDGKDKTDTIHRGEVKKHFNSYESSTSWEGDEWDYDVENTLEVKWLYAQKEM